MAFIFLTLIFMEHVKISDLWIKLSLQNLYIVWI